MAAFNFNTADVEPMEPRSNEPLPAGTYTVEITGVELRDLKSKNGQGLSIEFTVIDPEQHARRKVWTNLNIIHNNPTAEKIGRQELAALCTACGVPKLEDTDELFQRMLRIQTEVRPADPVKGYPARAEVKGYAAAGVPLPATSAPAPAKPAANGAAKPWQRAA